MPSIKKISQEQWLEARKAGVGASDIGHIAQLSNPAYAKSPRDIFNLKLGLAEPDPENNNMRWGTKLEDFLQEEFEFKHPEFAGKVKRDNVIRVHPTYPWAICSLDRQIVGQEEGVMPLELKTTTSYAMNFWKDGVPLEYYAQVQWQLFVRGAKVGWLFVGILDKRDTFEMRIERDDAFIATLVEKGAQFMQALEAQDPSILPFTASDADKLEPIEGKFVEATDEVKQIIDKVLELSNTQSVAEKSEKELKARLKEFIADAEQITDGDKVLCTYRMVEKDSYVVKAMKYRVLNVVRPKKEKK